MVPDMRTRSVSPCEKLPAPLRALAPVTLLCALAAFLLPDAARAQDVPSSPPTLAAAEPAANLSSRAGLTEPPTGRSPAARSSGVRLLSGGGDAPRSVGEVLLSRALAGPPDGGGPGPDLESLRDFLPDALYRDVLELKDRVIRLRSRVFGREGIVSLGRAGREGDLGRLRLNLQYSPDPGIRVTLVTG